MTYELAQKLKDAGFEIPFGSKGRLICKAQALAEEQCIFVSCDHKKCILNLEEVYIPTLSELIEACRKDCPEFVLHIYPHGCVIERKEFDDMRIQLTPEESVANLWLALNNK